MRNSKEVVYIETKIRASEILTLGIAEYGMSLNYML